MNYLAIDCSGTNLTIIVRYNGVINKYFDKECGVNHSVALMPRTEELLEKSGATLNDMDFFVAVTGAGSFTGIRIGVSAVKGLAFACKKPCLNITSFDTLAYNTIDGKVLAVIDAKHNGFYACGYDNGEVCFEPKYLSKDQLLALKGEYKFVADFSADYIDQVVSVCDGLIKAIENKKHLITYDLDSLVPLYVRKSQAEEGR